MALELLKEGDKPILERLGNDSYAKKIAKEALKIKAIKLRPDDPFEWASGYKMPMYNDNRMFLFFPEYRELITNALEEIISSEKISFDIIAGTSTAGIPPGVSLADRFNCPFIYIRDEAKDHGLRNKIEGIGSEEDLNGRRVIVIEDLISRGGSSARAVQAVRDTNGRVDYCLSIFNYGFDEAVQAFLDLKPCCKVRSILNYDVLLNMIGENGYFTDIQMKVLKEWRDDPYNWGEKHGFPKVNVTSRREG